VDLCECFSFTGVEAGPSSTLWGFIRIPTKAIQVSPHHTRLEINNIAADWTPTASRDEILETFDGFHPKFLRLMDLPAASPILKWQIKVAPLLPTWIRGRTALLGDSAHATLPLLGQGLALAVEEAATLGCLLPRGTTRDEVPARLEAYQQLRKERGEYVNTESAAQAAVPEKRGTYLRCEWSFASSTTSRQRPLASSRNASISA
jgi:2-polyprenyl-6-methoxyphenol hydroxylase-like FAD-dependent oxidoreductase